MLIEFTPNLSTDEAAKEVFAELKITKYERRPSKFYPPEGEYYAGVADIYVVKVYAIKDSEKQHTHCIGINARPGHNPLIEDMLSRFSAKSWKFDKYR